MTPPVQKTSARTEKMRAAEHLDAPYDVVQEEVRTLAEQAYRQLHVDIIRGVRIPGERLRIEKLKSIYNIGPTPLREALQKLSADRLVVTEGNRGFKVAPLISTEFEDLNTARTSIEKEAIRLSIERGDNNWEAQIVAAHYLLEKEDKALGSAEHRIPDSWELANAAFHSAVVAACGSIWLLRARSGLHDLVERYRRASLYQKLGQRDLAVEHKAILNAVLDRDAVEACKLTEQHFALTAYTLSEATRSDEKFA